MGDIILLEIFHRQLTSQAAGMAGNQGTVNRNSALEPALQHVDIFEEQ